jgi:beta-phosphoglucomutase
MSKLYGFILDMNGTMIDDMWVHNQIWHDFLAKRGIDVSVDEIHRRTGGKTTPTILRMFLGNDLSEAEIAQYMDEKESLYRTLYKPHLKPVAGLIEFLNESKNLGIKLAVATSSFPPNIKFILTGLKLENTFDIVLSGPDVTHHKPDPEAFLTAASRLGVEPSHCLVFEDAPGGFEAAARAGMKSVAITTTMSAAELVGVKGIIQIASDFTAFNPQQLLSQI